MSSGAPRWPSSAAAAAAGDGRGAAASAMARSCVAKLQLFEQVHGDDNNMTEEHVLNRSFLILTTSLLLATSIASSILKPPSGMGCASCV